MADVFLSYAPQDREFANRLIRTFQARSDKDGLYIWHDGDIIAGDNWRDAIHDAMSDAKIMLVLLSAAALKNPSVIRSLNDFARQNKLVIPVLLDNVEIPYHINDVRVLDATRKDDAAVQKITDYTLHLLKNPGDYETLPVRHEVTITFDVHPDTNLGDIIARISRLKGTTSVRVQEKDVL